MIIIMNVDEITESVYADLLGREYKAESHTNNQNVRKKGTNLTRVNNNLRF